MVFVFLLLNETIRIYLIILFVFWLFFRVARFIYKSCYRKRMNFKERYGEKSWVLVTGATDGLGRCFAEEFAKEGFNIILVSRSENKLQRVANEIKVEHNIQVHTIAFDFNEKTSLDDYRSAFEKLNELYDISILVNNVGFFSMGPFSNTTIEEHLRLINVNVIPHTILTRLFSEPLSKRKNRSAVIDLSSIVSIYPFSNIATYCATKSYNYFLSRALAEEYQNVNIDFLTTRICLAETNMTKSKADGLGVLPSKQVVKGILLDLGYEKETYGHWIHKMQAFFLGFVPISLIYCLAKFATSTPRTETKNKND